MDVSMTVNSDSQSGRLRHDWQYTELTFPLAVRGFHIYTLTRLCTTDWKATESEKGTQQHRGQICHHWQETKVLEILIPFNSIDAKTL